MRKNENQLQDLQEDLTLAFPGGEWLRILEIVGITGIADSIQLRTATGLERTRLHRLMDKLTSLGAGLPPMLNQLDHTIPRIGQRGRLPKIFLLGETGAALLRARGVEDARSCELYDDHAMAHALCMVDVHLSATSQGLVVHTDRVISFRDTGMLRPDHQITLSDGAKMIVEVEQVARADLVPRISSSLQNKVKFFGTPECSNYSSDIRMVINIQPGHKFTQTCNVWRNVVETIREELGNPLSFRLLAIPLVDFLLEPEWNVEATKRWMDLTTARPEPISNRAERIENTRITENSKEDLILLRAFHQVRLEKHDIERLQKSDRNFLDVLLEIYEISHPSDLNNPIRWAPPRDSIAMLRDYLDMHPVLIYRLRTAIHQNTSKWSWNTRTILHRMERVIDTFLAYHGWVNNAYLSARAVSVDSAGTDPFNIKVKSVNLFWGDYDLTRRKMEALEWVLMALFKHAEMLVACLKSNST